MRTGRLSMRGSKIVRTLVDFAAETEGRVAPTTLSDTALALRCLRVRASVRRAQPGQALVVPGTGAFHRRADLEHAHIIERPRPPCGWCRCGSVSSPHHPQLARNVRERGLKVLRGRVVEKDVGSVRVVGLA